jgi:hypothetical protein
VEIIVEQPSQCGPPVIAGVFRGAEFGGVDTGEVVRGKPARAVLGEQAGAGELSEQRRRRGSGESGQASGRVDPVNSSLIATALVPIAKTLYVPVGKTAVLVSGLCLASAIAQPTAGKQAE